MGNFDEFIRGANQPWRLGKFYSDSRFAFKDGGHGYVNELEGLAEQPCQVLCFLATSFH